MDARSSEWGAVFLHHLAVAHALDGDPEQACAVALRVIRIARHAGSARLTKEVAHLRAALVKRWPGKTCVAELADALR